MLCTGLNGKISKSVNASSWSFGRPYTLLTRFELSEDAAQDISYDRYLSLFEITIEEMRDINRWVSRSHSLSPCHGQMV